jgi:hypothetical protein
LTHMLKNSFAIPIIVVFVWVSANFINYENLSTTTNMASVPSHSKRHVIKSIETLSNGPDGIKKAYTARTCSCVPTWYFGTSRMCERNVLCLYSFLANKMFSPTISWSFSHHGVPPWVHHVCAQLSFRHIN